MKAKRERVNYTSSTVTAEMVTIMNNFYENKTLILRGKELLLDESTDNANRSQPSIMARWNGDSGIQEHLRTDDRNLGS